MTVPVESPRINDNIKPSPLIRKKNSYAPPSSRALNWKNVRRSWRAYLLLSPFLLLMIVFLYYPPILGLIGAFFQWQPGQPYIFTGLENFTAYLTYPETGREFANIAKLLAFFLFAGAVIPFVMAELIFSVRASRAKEIYRFLISIPMIVPGIVIILLWTRLYDPYLGPINVLLRGIGLGSLAPNWLSDPNIALYAIMGIGFPWVGGANTLIYLGGLSQIPESIYDAALLDNCTGIRRALRIDLPLVRGQLRLLMILAVVAGFTSYESVLVMTQGGPGFATTVPGLTMYERAFGAGQFGYASAIGLILFVLAVGTTLIINRLFRRSDE
jgi:raffinose/stachyose/melibiose transport system permease protein